MAVAFQRKSLSLQKNEREEQQIFGMVKRIDIQQVSNENAKHGLSRNETLPLANSYFVNR